MTPDERGEVNLFRLKDKLNAVPAHIVNGGFILSKSPVAGDWFLYSDDLRGMGRQWIACFPAGKYYFGGLAQFIEAFDPVTIRHLLARVEAAESGMESAIAEAQRRGYENGAQSMRSRGCAAARSVYESPDGPSDDLDRGRRGGVYDAARAVADTPLHVGRAMTPQQCLPPEGAELLPCPFCGSTEPELHHDLSGDQVWCTNEACAASGPASVDGAEIAVAAWNTRYDRPVPPREGE